MTSFNLEPYLKKQLTIALFLNIGHVMVGYSVAWPAPMVPKLQDIQRSPFLHTISLSHASWLGSCFNIAVAIGPYVAAQVANRFGRKICLFVAGVLAIVGYIVIICANSVSMLIVGRFISGLGTGTTCVIDLVYIGEMASADIRGFILTSTGVFHAFGCLLVYSVGPYLSYAGVEYVFIAMAIIYLISFIYIPESPLFYILKGKEEKAVSTLRRLGRGGNIERELKSITDEALQNKEQNWTWKEIFTIKSNRKSFIITAFMYIFQESSGILALGNFVTNVFQNVGSFMDPAIATIIIGITQFVTTLVAPSFIERLGRKTLLLISTAGCSTFMALLGTYFYLDFLKSPLVVSIEWLPLAALMLTYCSYSIGLNIIPNTLLAEMYRPNIRSIGTTVSMSLGWITGFLSITSFGYIVEALGNHVIFWIFAAVNATAFIFTVFVVPETKGMTLTEIDRMLAE